MGNFLRGHTSRPGELQVLVDRNGCKTQNGSRAWELFRRARASKRSGLGKRVRRATEAPENVKKFPDAARGNFIADRGKGMG